MSSPVPAGQPMFRRALLLNILSMLAAGTLAFLVYSRALDFAFFNDDPSGHFAWMSGRSYADYFRTSADYGYYRPIVFVVLQGLIDTVAYNARIFHALLLGLHAANVALLWLLVWRLSANRPYAWAAALIFSFAPFSYEAVAYVASLTHPLFLFWLLLTLLLYQQARRSTAEMRFIYYGLAMLTFVLGLLTHENGLMIPLALIGVEWLARPPRGLLEGLKRPFWPYLLVAPVFLLLWWTIPKTSALSLPTLTDWFSNMVPFLETLVYPLLPIVSLTAEQTTLLLLLAVGTLLLTFLAARAAHAVAIWLFAVGWFVVSSLPATLFLSGEYLYGSPRLHYLPSVGVAMLWGLPILALSRHLNAALWKRPAIAAAALVYVLAIILPPLPFIDCELDFYAESGRIARRMGELGAETAAGKALLFVNLPVFFSSYAAHPQGCENPYPWTPRGAVMIPDYADAQDFVRYNGGTGALADGATVAAYGPGWRTFGDELEPEALRERVQRDRVYVFDLIRGDFFDLSAAWLPGAASAEEPQARFGEKMALMASDVRRSADELSVTLIWRAVAASSAATAPAVFVHLYDESGQLAAQHDGAPAAGFVPRAWWEAQDAIVDRHILTLSEELSPGSYQVAVGVYDPVSGERYAAVSDGTAVADNAFVIAQFSLP